MVDAAPSIADGEAPPLVRAADEGRAELLRASPGAVYRCVRGSDGRIIWVEQEGTLAESWDLTTPDVAGRMLEELFPGEALRVVQAGLERAFTGQEIEFEHASRGRMLRHVARPVMVDGRVASVIGSITDVTSAERADEDARIFASAVGHDLRGPLTVARNYNAILRRRYGERLDDEGRRHLQQIDDALARMSGFMEDLLRLTEASRVDLDIHEVDLTEVASQTAAILRENEPDRKARIEIDDMMLAWGDDRLLAMLVETLLSAAWRGTARSPGARIAFTTTRRGGEATFSLSVLGASMTPERAARLFRGDEQPHETGGLGATGLALATIDCIVRRHGGRVWTERVDRGAAVCFSLGGAPTWT